MAPVAPVAPVAPGAPAGPVGPAAPCGPVLPEQAVRPMPAATRTESVMSFDVRICTASLRTDLTADETETRRASLRGELVEEDSTPIVSGSVKDYRSLLAASLRPGVVASGDRKALLRRNPRASRPRAASHLVTSAGAGRRNDFADRGRACTRNKLISPLAQGAAVGSGHADRHRHSKWTDPVGFASADRGARPIPPSYRRDRHAIGRDSGIHYRFIWRRRPAARATAPYGGPRTGVHGRPENFAPKLIEVQAPNWRRKRAVSAPSPLGEAQEFR